MTGPAEAPFSPERWADFWNRGDLDALTSLLAPQCRLASPLARGHTGSSVLRGRQAIRRYWNAAIARTGPVRFSVERTFRDEAARTLIILYAGSVPGGRFRACELMAFDSVGRIERIEAFYGANEAMP